MKRIANFIERNSSKILISEIIMFIVLFVPILIHLHYSSENPFIHLSVYSKSLWDNTDFEIVLAFVHCGALYADVVLLFVFPTIFVLHIVFMKEKKLFSVTNIVLSIVLIPLFLMNVVQLFSGLFKPASYAKHIISYTRFPDEYLVDSINIEEYKKHQESGVWSYRLEDFNNEEVALVSRVLTNENDSCYLMTYLPEKTIYKYQQYYYADGKIKARGLFVNNFKVDEWTYYDQGGRSSVVDEIVKYPFMHTYSDLLYLLDEGNYINVWDGDSRESFSLEYKQENDKNENNPYWKVALKDSIAHKVLRFDARTGRRLYF